MHFSPWWMQNTTGDLPLPSRSSPKSAALRCLPQPKCDRYWPARLGSVEKHGDFKVINAGEQNYGPYLTRSLDVTNCLNGEVRRVTQYHYLGVPDGRARPHAHSHSHFCVLADGTCGMSRLQIVFWWGDCVR